MTLIRQVRPALTLVAAASMLSACSFFDGPSKPKNAYDDEGRERISILTTTQYLDADNAIAGIPVAVPAPFLNKNWAQAGANASHAAQHLSLDDNLSQVWRVSVGSGDRDYERIISSPVAADGKVFAVDVEGTVSAFTLETGRSLWSTELAPTNGDRSDLGYGGGASYANGNVYATSGYGFAVALDADTGREMWRYAAGVPLRGAPTIAEGKVFVTTHDNLIVALDEQSGELLWEHVGIAETAGMLGAASPAYENGALVHALSSGELIALRAANGRVLWQDALTSSQRLTPLATLADIDAFPVIDSGKVYAVSHGGRMVAIDMRSGERSWEADIAGVNTPWIAGNFAFLATIDSQVVSMTLGDGRIRWVTQLQRFLNQEKRRDLIKWNGPVLAGDRLVLTSSHGYVVTLSPYTGEVLSGTKMPSGSTTSPIVVDNTLIVLTNNGDLVAYR
ncbi:outer membrane protein assembly factor BamB [Kordiimonas sediminis]|uniref:Outer membrane protein assembly factor BamB n=1 Tax=Kordiimonas sediminis TaxID=1735581 RepID=A0A919AX77_9PROT|nr:PQQ-binding-like beta-propeller repeat protein [Kordiimonas sediminis]GHF27765.1 outer membrane protein assembly factor BamB [Kordiimonas sediminis]